MGMLTFMLKMASRVLDKIVAKVNIKQNLLEGRNIAGIQKTFGAQKERKILLKIGFGNFPDYELGLYKMGYYVSGGRIINLPNLLEDKADVIIGMSPTTLFYLVEGVDDDGKPYKAVVAWAHGEIAYVNRNPLDPVEGAVQLIDMILDQNRDELKQLISGWKSKIFKKPGQSIHQGKPEQKRDAIFDAIAIKMGRNPR